ncbi:hypothetical protein GCM10009119_36080 [Algoriphagus jejuensis]|uniref:Dienelactone hydrolase domain-containing protein n=1 Tax=Algoriphagus jejuensis TaxID=419934 RepID=A0ABP3YH82_9BACT
MKRFLGAFLVLFQLSLAWGQTSLEKIMLKPGRYPVGFNHYLAHDSTRSYQRIYDWNNQSIPRPIPISIWYPSVDPPADTEPLKVVDYMQILKEEEEWEHLPDEQILNWFYYANTPANQSHLEENVTAFRNLNPARGKFPVVVYAPSYEASSIENFAICEYLASHGYLVIASPSRGADTRFFEGGTGKDLETQARDIEFLVKEIAGYPNANLEKIATVGFSFGGLSNVLSQVRNEQIKAIVSLDGSIKYQYPTLKKSPFFDINQVNVPFIHMAQKEIPEQVIEEDKLDSTLDQFEFYDSLKYSDAYQLQFHNLTHGHFSTLGVLFQERDKRQDKTDSEIMESYRWACVYALNFLNAYLKQDSKALVFLENQSHQNGVNSGLISATRKNAQKPIFTFQDFNELAAKQDYQNLKELYVQTKKNHPSLKLPEGNLNNLGLQLVFNPKTSQKGIKVFLLATDIYPNSANLFDSLAEGYLFLDDQANAKANFEKSLKLDSGNQNAINRLQQLSGNGPIR